MGFTVALTETVEIKRKKTRFLWNLLVTLKKSVEMDWKTQYGIVRSNNVG